MMKYRKILAVIFLCSSSSLAYEIALTRIFSISLWYHFAFMIISISMLGIGASGTCLSLYPKLKNLSHIGGYSCFLGAGISLSYIFSNQIPFDPVKLSWSKMQILYIGIYYITLAFPFFFAGLITATALSTLSEKSGLLYGADLLGAGVGSTGVLYLMTTGSPEKAVFTLSLIALSASFIAGGKKLKAISGSFMLINISILLIHPGWIDPGMSQYKGLQTALRYPGAAHLKTYYSISSRIDTLRSPAVRFAPGLSLKYLDDLPDQIGFSIDGGELNAITEYGSKASLAFLGYLPSSLSYEIKKPEDVLILDPKGGLEVLVAEYYHSRDIDRIESNPLLIKVLNKDFRDFSGGIYTQNTWAGLGRTWLKSRDSKFDIIDIQMMGTTPSGSFGISEDYRFTVEAFREYLNHLKPEGMISISLFILPPPKTELRILSTAISAMEELGIRNTQAHIAAIRSWGSISILIKKSSFTIDEIESIKKFSEDRRFDLIHYPGVRENETNIYVRMHSNEYFRAFEKILDDAARKHFMDAYLFDIKPVRDDNPFFSYFLKIKNIKEIYKTMGGKWQYFIEEGYILPVIFLQVLLFSAVLVILPATKSNNAKVHHVKAKKKTDLNPGLNLLIYFAFLALGFMFIEVSLVQKMILPLENPSYAFATVLIAILISSGTGSLFSYRFPLLRNPAVPVILSFIIIVYSFLLQPVIDIISGYPVVMKILLSIFVFIPLGFLMGIPFPTGMEILGKKNVSIIPWAWAINSCLSVLAPVLTIILAIICGFKAVLWLGALMYAMAYVVMKRFLKKSI